MLIFPLSDNGHLAKTKHSDVKQAKLFAELTTQHASKDK